MVADAVRGVYGESYFNRRVYDQGWLASEIEAGRMAPVVVRDGRTIAGHLALLRPAPNPHLVELGLGVVHPAYRKRGILAFLTRLLTAAAAEDARCPGVLVMPVAAHRITQRVAARQGHADTGFLLSYLPGAMVERYGAARSGAVLLAFRALGALKAEGETGRATGRSLHIPAEDGGWIAPVRAAARLAEPLIAHREDAAPARPSSAISESVNPASRRARLSVAAIGQDLDACVARFERGLGPGFGAEAILALDDPAAPRAIRRLRRRGYAMTALFPHYFANGAHGAVMFSAAGDWGLGAIDPYSETATAILAQVRAARERELVPG